MNHPKPPATAEQIPTEWTDMIRDMTEGADIRGLGSEPVIEVKSKTTGQWHPLMLPGGGTKFANYDERNAVLKRITNERTNPHN